MENSNEATIIFDSRPENEGLARVTAAAFCTQLNPTLEEVADLKTAVSEAVRTPFIWTLRMTAWGFRILPKLWSLCIPPGQTRIGPAWDLHLWRRLWTR